MALKGSEGKNMAQYTMVNIEDDFWRRVKVMALMRGKSLKRLILDLLRDELEMYERERRGS